MNLNSETPEDPVVLTPADRQPDSQAAPNRLSGVLYPDVYVWYVLLASLDIMLTWVVLHLGGREVNTVADWVIDRWGAPGIVSYKFGLVMLVVGICEFVGRRNGRTGRKLAEWAVAVSSIPVILAFVQLLLKIHIQGGGE
jgi:hypothetical protein